MHALATIDMAPQVANRAAPSKIAGENDQSFGKVLNAKQQPQQLKGKANSAQQVAGSDEASVAQLNQEFSEEVEKTEVTIAAVKQAVARSLGRQKQPAEIEIEAVLEPQIKLQQTLVGLIKDISKVENSDDGVDLTTLVNDLVQQLDQRELHGEQVLAGVDLSGLVEELQADQESDDHDAHLSELVIDLEKQLREGIEQTGVSDSNTAVAVALPQQDDKSLIGGENLSRARQILQQAVDTLVPRPAGARAENVEREVVVLTAEQPAENRSQLPSDVTEEIDPRFTELLKPRAEKVVTPQAQVAKAQAVEPKLKHQVTEQKQADPALPVVSAELLEQAPQQEQLHSISLLKQTMDTLVHQGARDLQPQGQMITPNGETARALPQTPVIQLGSGQVVAESQIFDQVVTHISGSFNGESGRMVLRLQPAELGSLKLELKIEGDRVQANLHAQSTQVQEILERNLPQLRHALAEQGLKIDQFQVNVDQRQQGGQYENLAQRQHHQDSSQQHPWQARQEQEEQVIPLAHLIQNGGGGISLHV